MPAEILERSVKDWIEVAPACGARGGSPERLTSEF